ncbi:cytoplasmic protein [Shewanella sp. C32]|uniref:Cytoplasmic protein n=1 Tax=Shewanella electrica TaxID=515560 RepID=A0ABT2FNC3_9GAMM|nr:cytoplasmic protein [Shewanella electrica]MCH1925563.1 cytoplasmic protein [Shewanella electrica]MCS4557130.1 cytoplasmic protein [Shewanella electrica]
MAISLSSQAVTPNLDNGAVGVRVAQLAKDQQKAEGQIALNLIQAAAPSQPAPKPEGSLGHNIDVTA